MLTLPTWTNPAVDHYTLTWDAWNRLVEVKAGSTSIAAYAYVGLTRRTKRMEGAETRHFFYNNQWRAVEERVEGAGTLVDRHYTWGMRDRWDLLRRKRSTGSSSLNEVRFCLRDYLDPVATAGADGLVQERFGYDASGEVRFMNAGFEVADQSLQGWEFLFHGEFQGMKKHFALHLAFPCLHRSQKHQLLELSRCRL